MRAVRAVRAGEAKLRGRMYTVILIVGPPKCEYPGVFRFSCSSSLVRRRIGFNSMLLKTSVRLCVARGFHYLWTPYAWVLSVFLCLLSLLLAFCCHLHWF